MFGQETSHTLRISQGFLSQKKLSNGLTLIYYGLYILTWPSTIGGDTTPIISEGDSPEKEVVDSHANFQPLEISDRGSLSRDSV